VKQKGSLNGGTHPTLTTGWSTFSILPDWTNWVGGLLTIRLWSDEAGGSFFAKTNSRRSLTSAGPNSRGASGGDESDERQAPPDPRVSSSSKDIRGGFLFF